MKPLILLGLLPLLYFCSPPKKESDVLQEQILLSDFYKNNNVRKRAIDSNFYKSEWIDLVGDGQKKEFWVFYVADTSFGTDKDTFFEVCTIREGKLNVLFSDTTNTPLAGYCNTKLIHNKTNTHLIFYSTPSGGASGNTPLLLTAFSYGNGHLTLLNNEKWSYLNNVTPYFEKDLVFKDLDNQKYFSVTLSPKTYSFEEINYSVNIKK